MLSQAVSLPVCDDVACRDAGASTSKPVLPRYCSAAVSLMVSKASRRSPRLRARSVTSSSSRDLISEPSWARWRSRNSGPSRSMERSRRRTWASRQLTKPQSRLSRSSASWNPSGQAPSAMMRKARDGVGGAVGVPHLAGVELVTLGGCAVEGGVLADGIGDDCPAVSVAVSMVSMFSMVVPTISYDGCPAGTDSCCLLKVVKSSKTQRFLSVS